ncbi:hypothetical protein KIH31_05555 [Paenarthrobacter sp. DKR-5]|uniref:hypothetical protein n=1 Tax=Paenarthrobacter sp. DKR-5 TaxID=2835535 RepID=UPI001BDCF762|nr:hypothetical protein [Paenarthrobacter sp. DKR-5]MBT1002060.1 hypothetical protein [Paenarthrobacter sp. DKR-5]
MRALRSAVLTVDSVALLCLLLLRVGGWLSPPPQDGEGRFWLGLLLAYGLLLLGAVTVALNVTYLVALVFRHGRYDNRYGTASRALIWILPALATLLLLA